MTAIGRLRMKLEADQFLVQIMDASLCKFVDVLLEV